MNWDAVKPLAVLIFTSLLKIVGGALMTHGVLTAGLSYETFIGVATTAGGAFWSWWVQSGHQQAADYLKKLTDTATQAAAIEVAKRMSPAAVTGAAVPAKAEAKAIEPAVMAKDAAKAALILLAIVLGSLAFPHRASAQVKFKSPGQIQTDIDNALKNTNQKVVAAVTPAPTSTAALPCMDISVLTKLTPQNLVPTLKGCEQDGINQLVTDTSRALDSAKAFTGSATGTTAAGDNDAINCLAPGLALFKAATIVSAVPDTPAVLNADGTVKTPAVAGTPEIDPGPILLFQKYREFTIVGGLTSCQTWINGPINATAAAGIAGLGTVVAGGALLAPK